MKKIICLFLTLTLVSLILVASCGLRGPLYFSEKNNPRPRENIKSLKK